MFLSGLTGTGIADEVAAPQIELVRRRRRQGRRREHSTGAGPRRRARPHPLPVRKGQAGQERLQRQMRRLLAAADRLRQAARDRRSKGLPPRNHEAHRRASAGHLQPSPALHLRQGHPEGSDEWRGARCLRCRVVRGLSRRRQGREGHQQWRRPIARRLRLLGDVARGRNEPGPLTQIPGPLTCDRVGPGNPTKGQATCTIQTRRGSAP